MWDLDQEDTAAWKHSQLRSTPPRGHWDSFIVNLGCGGGCSETGRAFLSQVYEWVTGLVGNRNMSAKVFIIVWGLTEHGGHLVLMIIKQCLLTRKALMTREVIYCTVQAWIGSAGEQEELPGPRWRQLC